MILFFVILNLIQDLPEDLPHIPSGDCGSSPQ